MQQLKIVVHGRVQGVFYRATTVDKAKEFGITGYVMNQSDGSVLIHAEGEKETLGKFVEWCGIGPSHAKVTKVDISEMEPENFVGFKIKRF